MNLRKHRDTKFVKSENLGRYINTPLLDRYYELQSEYKIGIHEVVKKRKHDVDDIAVHVSLYVYQLSKLHLYKFILVLYEFLMPKTFKLLYMGKFYLPNITFAQVNACSFF